MRRILVLCLILLSLNAFSQKFNAGIEVGLNNSILNNQTGTQYIGIISTNSFQLGGIAEYELGSGFYGQSGLLFSQKGCDKYPTNQNLGSSSTLKLSYLELPLNLEYKINLTKNFKGIIGAGFYIARGISGSESGIDNSTGITVPFNLPVHFTTDNTTNTAIESINPYDFGYNLLLGVQYKNFQIKANMNNGFSKVLMQGGTRYQNQVLNVSAGYLFKI